MMPVFVEDLENIGKCKEYNNHPVHCLKVIIVEILGLYPPRLLQKWHRTIHIILKPTFSLEICEHFSMSINIPPTLQVMAVQCSACAWVVTGVLILRVLGGSVERGPPPICAGCSPPSFLLDLLATAMLSPGPPSCLLLSVDIVPDL